MFTVYAPNLTPLGLIENYTSMQWTRRYCKAGQFELHLPYTSGLIAPGNIIRNGDEAAEIESFTITRTDSGVSAEVHGRTLLSYLDRRIVWGLVALTDTAENVMREIVSTNLRALPVTVAAASGYAGTIEYQQSYANLLSEVEAIAEMSELGVTIGFDRVFRVCAGLDRTVDQAANPRAIFARSFENVLTSEYFIDQSDFKNVALVGGQDKTDKERLFATVGNATGLDRRETFINATDIGSGTSEDPIDETTQIAMLTTRGQSELAALKSSEAFSATVDPSGNLRYKVDYDLGDIVTVLDQGFQTNARITEIKEIYESGGITLELTLGYERVIKIG